MASRDIFHEALRQFRTYRRIIGKNEPDRVLFLAVTEDVFEGSFAEPFGAEAIVFDDAHGHYYLVDVGWNHMKRIHGFTLHIDLRQDKIWIQQDWTEEGVAGDLMEAGIPKSDIVLAFHAPYKRPYTGFSTA